MKTLTKYWFLEEFIFFKKLEPSIMMEMCELLEMKDINKGSRIGIGSCNKRYVYFLKKGAIKIMNSENDTTKYLVKKGNIFGEISLYSKKTSSKEVALALEDSSIFFIESEKVEGLMEKYESLKIAVLKIYESRIQKLENRLQDQLHKDSKTRISEFIKSFTENFGIDKIDCIEAKNLLSHKDIANLTNTSQQTVNNVLSTLRKEKNIDYDSKYISILK